MTNLDIYVNAHDKTKGVFAGVRKNLGSMLNVAGGIGIYQAVEGGLKSVASAATAAYAAGRESREAQAQLNAVLESTGGVAGVSADAVDALSRSLMHHSVVDDDVIKSSAAVLLTFTKIGSSIFPQAEQAALNMSRALGSDLQSATILVGKALNDPVKGMTALTRAGVSFTEGQKEQIKALVESGNTLEAQKGILAELNKEFGGAAQAERDAYGPLISLKQGYDDAQEAAGNFLNGGLILISRWISDHKDEAVSIWNDAKAALAPFAEQAETQIGGIIGSAEALWETFSDGIDFFRDLINGDWSDAWGKAKEVAEDFGKLMINNLAAAFGALPNIMIDAVESGINGVIGLINQIDLAVPSNVLTKKLGIAGDNILSPDIGNVSLPRVPTKPFDVGKLFDDIKNAGDKASKPTRKLADDLDELGEAAEKASTTVYDAISQIRGAASALYGTGTKEEIANQLQQENLQGRIDAIHSERVRVTLGQSGQGEIYARQEQELKKQLDAAKAAGDAMQRQNKVQQLQLQLADKTLLSEREQNTAFRELLQTTKDLTGPIKDAGTALGLTLIKGVDDLNSAHGEAAAAIRSDVIPALRDDLVGAIRDVVTFVNTATAAAPATPSGSPVGAGGPGWGYDPYSSIAG